MELNFQNIPRLQDLASVTPRAYESAQLNTIEQPVYAFWKNDLEQNLQTVIKFCFLCTLFFIFSST